MGSKLEGIYLAAGSPVFLLFLRWPVWPDVGIKNCPFLEKIAKSSSFYLKLPYFKIAQTTKCFSYYCKKNCSQDHWKIAQSGHMPMDKRNF